MEKLLALGLFIELVGVIMVTIPALASKDEILKKMGWIADLEHVKTTDKQVKDIYLVKFGLLILIVGIGIQFFDALL